MRAVAIVGLAFGAAALAQTPPRPAFEAAAIHLVKDCREQPGTRGNLSPGRLSIPCVSIRALIRSAWGIFDADGKIAARRLDVIGGPAWLDSELYALDAKAEGAVSLDQTAGLMLQSFLEDRCKLKVHREARETPVYALTVSKGGPKLKESTPDSCTPLDLNHPPANPQEAPCGFPVTRGNNGNIVVDARGITIAEFAARALTRVDRPVVDKTGLTGHYDIHLEYTIAGPMRVNGGEAPDVTLPADPAGASMFSAVESLGLRLVSDKAPIDVIVVDSVERPSDN
ncbi:MAG TPA: TIGR03435 family protein [Bryobacteraceae bacterium]|nr:TIGR03435 family protein [Bryobacteraceae bacterium]